MTERKYMVVIFFLILCLVASVYLTLKTTVFYGKAANVNTSPVAPDNSYLFASPLQAKADGQEQIRLTVFVLDGRGLGITNKTVSLVRHNLLTVVETQPVTDDAGKAVFDIASVSPNSYPIEARVDGGSLPQKVKVVFY